MIKGENYTRDRYFNASRPSKTSFETKWMRLTGVFLFFLVVTAVSCKKKIDTIPETYILTLPSLTVKDFETVYTDSGKVQLVLSAPVMESYKNTDNPYSEFRSGLRVYFHDGNRESIATVRAKYARYTDSKNLWELKDSVIAINENGDKLETELLFWDQKKELIYTDRFVKITNEDQIVQGFGFESDPRLTRRKIKNVSATIYVAEDQ